MVVAVDENAGATIQIECRQTSGRGVLKVDLTRTCQVQNDILAHRGVVIHYQAGVIQVDGLDQTGIVDDPVAV